MPPAGGVLGVESLEYSAAPRLPFRCLHSAGDSLKDRNVEELRSHLSRLAFLFTSSSNTRCWVSDAHTGTPIVTTGVKGRYAFRCAPTLDTLRFEKGALCGVVVYWF